MLRGMDPLHLAATAIIDTVCVPDEASLCSLFSLG